MVALLKSQKNDVFLKMKEVGLDPADFKWNADGDKVTQRQKTNYFCRFGANYISMSPGPNFSTEDVHDVYAWEDRMNAVEWWLYSLRTELETEDLWSSLRTGEGSPIAAAGESEDNRPFSAQEQRRIAECLREIPKIVRTPELNATQLKKLEAGMEYLIDSSRRFGRKDWFNLVSGTLFNVATSAALSPEAARGLFEAVFRSLNWLFGHLVLGSPQPLIGG